MTMRFVPGLELNEAFYHEVVGPLLEERHSRLPYSAALMGYGSDVLGYDNPTSMDHNWGPRLQLFLRREDAAEFADELRDDLSARLPTSFRGFPTNFCPPRADRTQTMEAIDSSPVNHLIEITTIEDYLTRSIGRPSPEELGPRDWLALDDQKLLELTSGRVFHDGLDRLEPIRRALAFFPRDVFLLRLARIWQGIEEDEPLIGRTLEVGTPLGTRILAARLAEHAVRICLSLEGRYIPYRKWMIRAFKDTSAFAEIGPLCEAVVTEPDERQVEARLCALYERLVARHNRRSDLPHLDNEVRNFHLRPYRVIFAETIVERLRGDLSDQSLADAL